MFTRIANIVARWNLVLRFNVAGLFIVLLGTVVIGRWVSDHIETGIINESAATTALYLDSFVAPNLQELDQSDALTPEHFENLNKILKNTDLGRQIAAIKVWDRSGKILFSNSPALIGRIFPDAEDLEISWQGNVVAKISDLTEDENIEERRQYSRLLEIYVPVRQTGTHKVIAIAEFYQKIDALEAEIALAQRKSWFAVGTGMGIVYLWLIGFFRWTRTRLQQQENALKNQVAQLTEVLSQNDELDQRIRRATANTTTLNEILLHRISMELTDGPVKEINLALMSIDRALSESTACKLIDKKNKCNQNLPIVHTSLMASLQEMHTIAAGLVLPQLEGSSLTEIFTSAVHNHELRTDTKVALNLKDLPDQIDLPLKIAAYRIVQEALNNAYRHAGGVGQVVQCMFNGTELQIEISDRGPGFDKPFSTIGEEHLGLVGMRERVESLGGVFSVESSINQGTSISALFLVPILETMHQEAT